MRPKNRQLTEKYKAFRLQPNALFLSRMIQTFFNKFTKKGKKALARHHLQNALIQFRMQLRRPVMYHALFRIFRRLRIQFLLVSRRKGRKILSVPVPVRRNKRDVISLQTLYKAISDRRERVLSTRIEKELVSLAFKYRQSPLVRKNSTHLAQVYEERVNMEYR
jgi:ribosomal protein S7